VGGISVAFVYTEAPRYDAQAALTGGERFPGGASLRYFSGGAERKLINTFAAAADACVSFDGRRVLFSGKQKGGDPWQIWEAALDGGPPRRITASGSDAIRPFYLPADKIVYAQRSPDGFQIEVLPVEGGAPNRLTYAPGNHIPTDVLRDGRILFEAPHPAAGLKGRDIYTVYPDGSGVETYRCDHGRDRYAGRQTSAGDVVFASGGKLARFISARAVELAMPALAGEFEGPVAEIGPDEFLAPYRADRRQPFALFRWRPGSAPVRLTGPLKSHALEPVVVAPRPAPKWFPSSLGDREGANLLCLNAYTSRLRIPAGAASRVRVWAIDDQGGAVALGEAPVEDDGSFYVQAPSERPIRFQLLDAAGRVVAEEKGWFWARRGEQRVCVGCHAGPERAPENAVPKTLLRSTRPAKMLLPVHTSFGGRK
jgi:hypothetical protein